MFTITPKPHSNIKDPHMSINQTKIQTSVSVHKSSEFCVCGLEPCFDQAPELHLSGPHVSPAVPGDLSAPSPVGSVDLQTET